MKSGTTSPPPRGASTRRSASAAARARATARRPAAVTRVSSPEPVTAISAASRAARCRSSPRAEAGIHEHLSGRIRHRESLRPRRFGRGRHPRDSARRPAGPHGRSEDSGRRRDRQGADRSRPNSQISAREAKIEAAGGRCEAARVERAPELRQHLRVPDLRKRVLFTFLLLAVYRLGSHIPTPGRRPHGDHEFFKARRRVPRVPRHLLRRRPAQLSVFALGIMPYISASIILQLLTVVWPYLEKLSKEGEMGRRKITQYTRYGTVLLSFVQAHGIALWLEKQTAPGGAPLVPNPGWGFRPDDRPDADHRHDLRHVARRADHRAGHRQRHLAHHLRRHRRRPVRGRSSVCSTRSARATSRS